MAKINSNLAFVYTQYILYGNSSELNKTSSGMKLPSGRMDSCALSVVIKCVDRKKLHAVSFRVVW